MDATARPWGRTHVKVRCAEGATWSLYVPVQIHVTVDYLVSARPLRAGQLIAEADITRREGDLAELPADVLMDPAQALGQSANVSLPANRPLRATMLSQPLVVRQGQNVKVVATGTGFQVSSEGRALNNAASGQVVQVRLSSGEVVRGVARRDGTVGVAN
jgi:flagella basal body P-ring formation protein FlgA